MAFGLILGVCTGIAVAGGLLISESYMLAGTAATSPLLTLFEILLTVAWKTPAISAWIVGCYPPGWGSQASITRMSSPDVGTCLSDSIKAGESGAAVPGLRLRQ